MDNEVIAILDKARDDLKKLGVSHFLAATDRKAGKIYTNADATGEDLTLILAVAFPDREALKHAALWIGQALLIKDNSKIKPLDNVKEIKHRGAKRRRDNRPS